MYSGLRCVRNIRHESVGDQDLLCTVGSHSGLHAGELPCATVRPWGPHAPMASSIPCFRPNPFRGTLAPRALARLPSCIPLAGRNVARPVMGSGDIFPHAAERPPPCPGERGEGEGEKTGRHTRPPPPPGRWPRPARPPAASRRRRRGGDTSLAGRARPARRSAAPPPDVPRAEVLLFPRLPPPLPRGRASAPLCRRPSRSCSPVGLVFAARSGISHNPHHASSRLAYRLVALPPAPRLAPPVGFFSLRR